MSVANADNSQISSKSFCEMVEGRSWSYLSNDCVTHKYFRDEVIGLVSFVIFGLIAILVIFNIIKKIKSAYKSLNLPLKSKVQKKELETRISELEGVKPAEHTYKKTAYVDDTEEINEVKKLERQIKIKKLQKELKDLEEE